MKRSLALKSGLLGAAIVSASAGHALAQAYTCGGKAGPDVIVGVLTGPQNYTATGGLDALSIGTTSCNVGTANVMWNALPSNTHPVIGGQLYRFKTVDGSGRFEQIGLSWLKHGFTALTNSDCCTCSGQGGSVLGVGCSDPYTASRNGGQNSNMGPRWQVNAHTGLYPAANTYHPATGNAGRIEIPTSELVVSSATVKYFGESQYVTQDDATATNQNNNASYIGVNVTGGPTDFSFAFTGTTQRAIPAIRAWPLQEAGVTLTDVQVPGDGLFVVGSKATSLGGGIWHYEYAVYNMNSDRNGGSFSVPVPASATVTNIDFHGVTYRYGDGSGGTSSASASFASTAWTGAKIGNAVSWACETETANVRANAIRWGTTYNFRFDANVAPSANDNVTVGLWKAATVGSPATSMNAMAQMPGCSPVTAVSTQPNPVTVCPIGTVTMTVAATATSPTYQWQRETSTPGVFTNIADGNTNTWDGNIPGVGGIVSGSNTATLNIAADTGAGKVLAFPHAVRYQCVVTGTCGTPATSSAARATLCTADYNCDNTTSIQDIFDYLGGFFAQDNRADFDHVGGVTVTDIFSFLSAWFTGC